MAKPSIKEIKGIVNLGFYPDHYLTTALGADAKAHGFSGDTFKALRKTLMSSVESLCERPSEGLIQEAAESIFKALGFYEVRGVGDNSLKLVLDGREFSCPTERIVPFIGDKGLLALFIDKGAVASGDEASSRDKAIEHFYQGDSPLKMRDRASYYSWRDVITAAFNSDYSTAENIIVCSGKQIHLLERGKWQESEAYMTFDLGTLFAVNADDGYQITESLLAAKAFPIASAESFHDVVGRNAHKKAAEVTKALRDTVRDSIEILANQILDTHRRKTIKELSQFDFENQVARDAAAKVIFDQSLRYIYRMLFMLFAEGQDGQKGSLPVHSKVYQLGYSIEKVRSLECVPFLDDNGNFIQQTLERAFRIYYDGYATEKSMVHNNATGRDEIRTNALGFSFPAVGTDLFSAAKTSLFKDVVISDRAMQEVIRKLSLAKTGSGKSARTQRVHYAGLGLNQLGAVYEGLLALKPVILSERVILLKKESKDLAHRYVPHSKRTEYDAELFETDDRDHPVDRKEGTFLLAPVGLERKFSASFYTPEVLTRFVAKEAVDVLLEKDSSLKRMESLKICEPAMGSGAFLNAVVDDLAKRMGAEYSKIDQTKMKAYRDRCEASGKPFRKDEAPAFYEMPYYVAKAKEHLMTHAVHGVDLNPTAVELAKISLWLNCLHENGNLPFLDFKLKHGNSLVGGWVKRHEIEVAGKKFPHFFVPRTESVKSHLDGLVLGLKEMPFIQDANVRRHVQTAQASWDAAMNDRSHLARLEKLSSRVMALYENHVKVRRQYRDKLQAAATAEAKKHAFEQFVSEDSAYNQLRAMMDYWCALWFWPNAELRHLPTFDSYLKGLEWLASNPLPYGAADKEKVLRQAGTKDLPIALRVAVEQCFFHWDLEFSEVFEEGGFDLVLGNPPWAPVRWEEEDFFEAVRPGMHAKAGDSKTKQGWYKAEIAANLDLVPAYVDAKATTLGFVNFMSDSATYPFVDQSPANTYKYFFQRFVQASREGGSYAILAQDGVLTEDRCAEIRSNVIRDIRRVYRFRNEFKYFEDVDHNVQFMVSSHVRGGHDACFELIDNLFDVSTIDACRRESRSAPYVGTKNPDGKWELRGHPDRVVRVDQSVLENLSSFTPGVTWDAATIPIIHGAPELEVLIRFARHKARLRDVDWYYWSQFHEAGAPKAGLIQRAPCKAESINEAVFTGPNIFVGNPANKSVNPTAKHNLDFSAIDLSAQRKDFFADSVYRVTEKGLKSPEYLAKTPWGAVHNHQYRIFSRGLQVSTTGARTFSSAIFPKMCSHINQICSLSFKSNSTLVIMSGLFNSLVFDFLVRAWSGGTISKSLLETMPALNLEQMNSPLVPALMVRALRLGCISAHYSDLWKEVWSSEFQDVEFESPFSPKLAYSKLKAAWEFDVCIREKSQREQALCEIDVIVAELFGFDKDTLLKLYRSQFGVLQGNLQDHPGQKVDPEKYHFPRYKQLSDAFDQLQRVKPHRLKPAS